VGLTTDVAVFDQLLQTIDAKLVAYDVILAKQKYLAGDVSCQVSCNTNSYSYHEPAPQEITLADLFHLPYGTTLGVVGSDLMTSKPNVARYVIHSIGDSGCRSAVLLDGGMTSRRGHLGSR